MKRAAALVAGVLSCCAMTAHAEPAAAPDARLREVVYDPQAVVTVPVQRGVVTMIILDADEQIQEVGAGLGSDCARPEAAWCIAAQPGGRSIFVKPKSAASGSNNLAIITDRRSHAFRFVLLPDGASHVPIYRLLVKAPAAPRPVASARGGEPLTLPLARAPASPAMSAEEVLAHRLDAPPEVVNSNYSIADGPGSQDIVPTLVFDDGRFTYLRFPGYSEVPAVFHVLGDGSETLVNTRMEDDLVVVDRVSRRLMLRAGQAVVGLWNDAFDIEGQPAVAGATVPGVRRALKPAAAPSTYRASPGARP